MTIWQSSPSCWNRNAARACTPGHLCWDECTGRCACHTCAPVTTHHLRLARRDPCRRGLGRRRTTERPAGTGETETPAWLIFSTMIRTTIVRVTNRVCGAVRRTGRSGFRSRQYRRDHRQLSRHLMVGLDEWHDTGFARVGQAMAGPRVARRPQWTDRPTRGSAGSGRTRPDFPHEAEPGAGACILFLARSRNGNAMALQPARTIASIRPIRSSISRRRRARRMGGTGYIPFLRHRPRNPRRQETPAFRAGFLGVESFGWSTLVVVTEVKAEERAAAVERLAEQLVAHCGAPILKQRGRPPKKKSRLRNRFAITRQTPYLPLHRASEQTGSGRRSVPFTRGWVD